jgi:glycosyltransferase involved in cell wall biosynthesis
MFCVANLWSLSIDMQSKSRVSVIIPAYNAEAFIAATLDSVLGQTLKADEILLVNDGSTDRTAEIVKQYAPTVTLINQANSGVSAARNKALESATGDYIAFIDADDLWTPTKLEKQIDFLEDHKDVSYLFSDELYFTGNQEVIIPSYLSKTQFSKEIKPHSFIIEAPIYWLLMESFVATSSVVCRKKSIDKAGLFDTALAICEDRDMWIRLAFEGPVGLIPEVLVHKRQDHGGNISDISRKKVFDGRLKVIERHRSKAFKKITSEGKDPRHAYIANYLQIAEYYWYKDDFKEARKHFHTLLKLGYFKALPKYLACLMGKVAINLLKKVKDG